LSDGMWSAHAIPPFHPGQVIDLPHVARVHYPFLEVWLNHILQFSFPAIIQYCLHNIKNCS